MQKRMKDAQEQLEKKYQAKLHELEAMFLPSMSMMQYAFDIENNRALLPERGRMAISIHKTSHAPQRLPPSPCLLLSESEQALAG